MEQVIIAVCSRCIVKIRVPVFCFDAAKQKDIVANWGDGFAFWFYALVRNDTTEALRCKTAVLKRKRHEIYYLGVVNLNKRVVNQYLEVVQ